MLEIKRNIYIKPFERKILLQTNKQKSTNNNIYETKQHELLSNNYYLPTNISFKSSEFLNESDLKRYRKIQKEFSEIMAKVLGTTPEEIFKKLPEIQLGNKSEMLQERLTACCQFSDNIIEIIPFRKLANSFGGDANSVIHESLHGLLHNLRRIYAKNLDKLELHNSIYNIILEKLANGEPSKIIKSVEKKSPKNPFGINTMTPPSLSAKERKALLNFITSLKTEHLNMNNKIVLNDKGKKLLKENLIPKLTEYSKTIIEAHDKKEKAIFNKILDYINATYQRKDVIIYSLGLDKTYEYEKSIKPLSAKEKDIAIYSLYNLLELIEGNFTLRTHASGSPQYFMSFEELLARDTANDYIMDKLIEQIHYRGLSSEKSLQTKYKTTIYNREFLDLIKKLKVLNNQIIGASKNTDKLIELEHMKKNLKILENQKKRLLIKIGVEKIDIKHINELINKLDKKAPLIQLLKTFLNLSIELSKKVEEFNTLNSPECLLKNTPKNNILKEEFNNLLKRIKKLAPKCCLSGIPKKFYNSKDEYIEANKKIIRIIKQCSKNL